MYYPQSNGQIERLHRYLKERLALIAYDSGLNMFKGEVDWSDYLDLIQYMWNNSVSSSTGHAPRDLLLPPLKKWLKPLVVSKDFPSYFKRYMHGRMELIRNRAKLKQKHYDKLREKAWDKKHFKSLKKPDRKTFQYEIYQRVLWNINAFRSQGSAAKLNAKWVGPYEIAEIFNDGQSIRLRVIELPEADRQAMNEGKLPKRGVLEPEDPKFDGTFVVPRSQIKPYYKSFELKYDELKTPLQRVVLALQLDKGKLSDQEVSEIIYQARK